MKRMNFLLVGINAKYIHLNPAIHSLRYSVPDDLRDNISIAEYTINHVYEWILMDIFRRRPDVIGISCYIWNMETVRKLCGDLAKVLPEVPVWLGGPEAAWSGDGLFDELPNIAGVMYGDGEIVFPELVEAYLACDEAEEYARLTRDTLLRIKGLRFRDTTRRSGTSDITVSDASGDITGGIIDTGAPAMAEMDRLPFIYDKEVDFSNRIVYYESSRGCPFCCSYCLSANDRTMRYRSLSLVLSELSWFLDRKVPQVKFLDRTFNSDRKRTLAIWQYLAEHDNGVTNFHFEITADLLSDEEIELLGRLRPGLVQLEIGVQSTNPDTLRDINRRMNWEKLAWAVERIRSGNNVHLHLDLIAGLPQEDFESFGRSFDDVYRLKPSQLQLGFLKVLKGSPIAVRAEEFGLVYRSAAPYEVLSTRWLTYEDVVALKGVEDAVETYYNSHQFELTLEALEREYDSPFALYGELARYCHRTNPEGRNLSRNGLYEQMKGFIHENFVNCAEIFDTLLTMDYYLREHARNRPAFAVGREVPCPVHSRDHHLEETGFDLELFRQTGEVRRENQLWLFDYSSRSPITNNASLRREIYENDKHE